MAGMEPDNHAAGPFDGLADEQVLARAAASLRRVHAAPLRSLERFLAWNAYEQAKAELDIRLYSHIVAQLKHQSGGAAGIPRQRSYGELR